MSSTPRTDEAQLCREPYSNPLRWVQASFARQLETELAEATRELKELREDKARLDWLDKEEFTSFEDEISGDENWYCYRLIFDSEPISVRAAVDAARRGA
jgi:hypothetical protein